MGRQAEPLGFGGRVGAGIVGPAGGQQLVNALPFGGQPGAGVGELGGLLALGFGAGAVSAIRFE